MGLRRARALLRLVDVVLLGAVEVDGLPRFFGGAVGYLGYDMVRYFEDLKAGDRFKSETYIVTEEQIVSFAREFDPGQCRPS